MIINRTKKWGKKYTNHGLWWPAYSNDFFQSKMNLSENSCHFVKVLSWIYYYLESYFSNQFNFCTRLCMRLLKHFVLETLCSKTKQWRRIARSLVQRHNWVERLGFSLTQDSQSESGIQSVFIERLPPKPYEKLPNLCILWPLFDFRT